MKADRPAADPASRRTGRVPRWLRRTLFWSTGPVVGYALVGAWLAWMFLHPMRQRGRGTPADYGLSFEPVTLTTPDGVKLAAWYVPCAGAQAGVVVCHGYGASRRYVTGLLPFLHRAGFAVISFDFRGMGESGGRFCSFGQCEKEDVRTASRYLRAHAGVGPGQVGALGLSMGGAAAIMAAAEDADIGAVVADCAFARLDQMVPQRFARFGRAGPPLACCTQWWGERLAGFSVSSVSPVAVAARLSPRPLLLIHGEADTHTPPAHSRELYAAARDPKELWIVPGAGHAGCYDTARDEYERRVTHFFRQALLLRR
jgi:dipeptidyl aminopeptidase/acylaminoacyl peptidase